MKVTVYEGTPEEIAELLQAIASSKEQKLINDYEAAKIANEAFNDPTKMPSFDSLYPSANNDISQEES
ncbi:TPA: hypothetical protein ACGBG5_003444 [Enterococcus faecalis]